MSCLSRNCMLCVKLFKWLPVLFITTVVVWSYYAYVIQLCIFTVDNYVEKIVFLIFYHFSFVMFVWSYWQTIFTEPGRIPRQFYLSPENAERLEKEPTEGLQAQILEQAAKGLPVLCRNFNGTVRYCEKCHIVKPDRAHHCSVCSTCVLKMDHHCPWVNNCVSFTNYKFFVLFLGYAIVYCLFVAATTFSYFLKFWTVRTEPEPSVPIYYHTSNQTSYNGVRDEMTGSYTVEGWGRLHILFLFFVAIMFGISLISLFCYHCYLVTLNRTTLESFRPPAFRFGPDKYAFSLGRYANFKEVFGDNKRLWFVPVFTSSGNGIEYPTRGLNQSGRMPLTSAGGGGMLPVEGVETDVDVESGFRGGAGGVPVAPGGMYSSDDSETTRAIHSGHSSTGDYRSMAVTQMPPISMTNTSSPTSGFHSPTNPSHTISHPINNTDKSFGDGISYPQRSEDLDTDGLLAQRQKWTDDETEDENQELDLREVKVVSQLSGEGPRSSDKV